MCLCFLTDKDRYFTIDLLGEYIYLGISDEGSIKAREIYDVFFTPRADWSDFRLICISPHDLISGGKLAVEVEPAPGMCPEDQVMYNATTGSEASFDANSGVFSVRVPAVTDRFQPTQEKHAGTVLDPQVSVPGQILNDARAVDVMIESGTVFEIAMGNVEAEKTYAVRLEINPYDLLGLPERSSLGTESYSQWSQEAHIFGPKLCQFNLGSTLRDIQQKALGADPAAGAALVDGTISNKQRPRVLVPLGQHRILLISQSPTLVDPRSPIGCVTSVGIYKVETQYGVAEWAGGTRTYWTDDIECTAERIWMYLSDYGVRDPKTKEAITAAMELPHTNCGLIVDALLGAGAVVETSPSLYQARQLDEPTRKQVFEELATDDTLIREFRWRCYQISYLSVYRHLSREDTRREQWRRFKQDWGFWFGRSGGASLTPWSSSKGLFVSLI